MSLNNLLNLIDIIILGGWDFAGECTLFTYLTQLKHMLRAAKVLAGHENPDVVVIPPTCQAFLNGRNEQIVTNLVAACFSNCSALSINGPLRQFLYTMLASLLMHLPSSVKLLGLEHPIHSTLKTNAQRFGITWRTLLDWGEMVMTKHRSDNVTPIPTDSPAMLQMQKDMVALKNKYDQSQSTLNDIYTELHLLRSQLSQMTITQMASSCLSFQPK